MKTSSVVIIALAVCFSQTVFADGAPRSQPASGQTAASKNTPITWAEASRSSEYKALDDTDKEEFRQMYWREVVAPAIPDYKRDEAHAKFDAETIPSSPLAMRTLEKLKRFMGMEIVPSPSAPPPEGTTCNKKVYEFPGWLKTCTTCQVHNISNTVCN